MPLTLSAMPDGPVPSSTPQSAPITPTITRFELGPFMTNAYVVGVPGSSDCWIIDAPFEPEPIIAHIRKHNLTPAALLLTHAHVDHIAGATEIRRAFPGVPVMIHEAEKAWLGDPFLNLSAAMGENITGPEPTRLLHDGDELTLAHTRWRVVHTPGHSPGGIAFVHIGTPHFALTGDALFAGSIGRTDFPGCSFKQLAASIRAKLYTLPDDTNIHPGHGPSTTIGNEKRTNPFVRA